MNGTRARVMDVSSPHRVAVGGAAKQRRPMSPVARQISWAIVGAIVAAAIVIGLNWYQHRNDQRILSDRYQVVYLLTGQVYFGKLQNTDGTYLTLKNVYQLQGQQSDADKTSNVSNIVQVSRQVYGPDDSMAIRADQVQFWQNLKSDSKVAQAIAGSEKNQ